MAWVQSSHTQRWWPVHRAPQVKGREAYSGCQPIDQTLTSAAWPNRYSYRSDLYIYICIDMSEIIFLAKSFYMLICKFIKKAFRFTQLPEMALGSPPPPVPPRTGPPPESSLQWSELIHILCLFFLEVTSAWVYSALIKLIFSHNLLLFQTQLTFFLPWHTRGCSQSKQDK